jgi:hypothetical protein
MSCEHLICAQCAGPVAEARCPVCRAAKSDLHHHHHSISLPQVVLLLLLALAVAVAVQHLAH